MRREISLISYSHRKITRKDKCVTFHQFLMSLFFFFLEVSYALVYSHMNFVFLVTYHGYLKREYIRFETSKLEIFSSFWWCSLIYCNFTTENRVKKTFFQLDHISVSFFLPLCFSLRFPEIIVRKQNKTIFLRHPEI